MKPENGYVRYIINPKAGASAVKATGRKFEKYLIKQGFEVRTALTVSLKHACELANDAAVDFNCAMVVVVGGDGTVREVMQGLEGSDKPLLIVAGGTENLLSNELGFDGKLNTIIDAFKNGQVKIFDLGNFNGSCFTSIAGFGFDGEIVNLVSNNRKGNITYGNYIWPVWRTFWEYKFPQMKIKVDDLEIYNGSAVVFVGNISRYALGIGILKNADYSDGLLDVCVYKCNSKWKFIKFSIMTFLGQHTKSKNVIYTQGKNISITSDMPEKIRTQIDGDPGPAFPVEIKVMPHAVNVLVPPNAKPVGFIKRIIRSIG